MSAEQLGSQDERSEILALRDANTEVFRESDGTFTAEISTEPTRVENIQGQWVDIDDSLVPADRKGFAWKNRTGPLSVNFSSVASETETVLLEGSDYSVGFGAVGSHDTKAIVEGSSIRYEEVYPGVDLVYDVAGESLKEFLVLNQPPATQSTYKFAMQLEGLTPQMEDNGEISLTNSSGKTILSIPHGLMTDSKLNPDSGSHSMSEKVEFDLRQEGDRYEISVTPDHEWLTSPNRVYPVSIDPSLGKETTRDTFVQSNLNAPQYTSDELRVGTFNSGATKARTMLLFDGLYEEIQGKNILEADLRMFQNYSTSCTPSEVGVHRTTQPVPTDVTWSNQPTAAATPLAVLNTAKGFSVYCNSGYTTFSSSELTETVQGWSDGSLPRHGLQLRAINETDTNSWKKFASSEAYGGVSPTLVVNYNSYPEVPVGEDLGVDDEVTTPTLYSTFQDPDGGTGQAFFTIYDHNGTVVVDDAAGSVVSAGVDSSYTVPSGLLDEGEFYLWKARSFDGVDYSQEFSEEDILQTGVASTVESDVSFQEGLPDPGTPVPMGGGNPNPWGCKMSAHWPHESTSSNPGSGHIHAKTSVWKCNQEPPNDVKYTVTQTLKRSSWTGWRKVRSSKTSTCVGTSGTPSGDGKPSCDTINWRMRASIWVNCEAKDLDHRWYKYRNISSGVMSRNGNHWYAYHTGTTGDEIYCH